MASTVLLSGCGVTISTASGSGHSSSPSSSQHPTPSSSTSSSSSSGSRSSTTRTSPTSSGSFSPSVTLTSYVWYPDRSLPAGQASGVGIHFPLPSSTTWVGSSSTVRQWGWVWTTPNFPQDAIAVSLVQTPISAFSRPSTPMLYQHNTFTGGVQTYITHTTKGVTGTEIVNLGSSQYGWANIWGKTVHSLLINITLAPNTHPNQELVERIMRNWNVSMIRTGREYGGTLPAWPLNPTQNSNQKSLPWWLR